MTATTVGPTTGPWRVEPRSLYETNVVAGNAAVATIHGWDLQQELADARLIAAAPDLLAELKDTFTGLQAERDGLACDAGNFDGGSPNDCVHCMFARWADRVGTVIAKAEGSHS